MSENSCSPEAPSPRSSASLDAERPRPSASARAVSVVGFRLPKKLDPELEKIVLVLLLRALEEANPGYTITTNDLMFLYEAVLQGTASLDQIHLDQEKERE